jgi:TolA-binding protein
MGRCRSFVALKGWLLGLMALVLIVPAWAEDAPQSTAAAIKQYRDAVALQNRGVYDLAADEWKEFLGKYGKDPLAGKAQHYLGVCQLQQKNYDDAIAAFNKAIKDYPASDITEQSYLNLGLAYYSVAQAGKSEAFDQAAATLAALVAKYPQGTQVGQAMYYQAESLYSHGKKAEAVAIYGPFIEKFKDSPLRPDALYALGVTQEELGKPAEARAVYDRFLKEYADHALKAEIIMRRAETLFAEQQFAEAEKGFAAAATVPNFKLADYSTVRGAASLQAQKKYAEAAALYASVPTKYPQSQYLPIALLSAGNCYYLAGNLGEAQRWLQQSIAAGGEGVTEAAHWLAKTLIKAKKPAEAIALVDKTLPQAGASPFAANLKLDKADALYELPDKRGEATALFAAVAKEYPQHAVAPQALYMAAFTALGAGQFQPALDSANAFLKSYAADALAPDVLFVSAEANMRLGKVPEAEAVYRQLIEKYPNHAETDAWKLRLGLTQFSQKKYAETIASLTPLVATFKKPESIAEAQYLIGSAQLELGQFDPAAKSLLASLHAAPKWRQADDTLLNLAAADRQLGKLAEAQAAVKKMIAEFPQSKLLDRATYRSGEIAYAKNDFDGAITQYQQLLEKFPQSPLVPNALYSLGWAQIGKNDFAGAAKTMTMLIDKHANHPLLPRARYARAIARQQLKEFAGGAEDARAFLESKPSATDKADAQYVLGLCEVGQQKWPEATGVFQAIVTENPQYAGLDKVLYELGWALKSQNKEAEAAAAFARLAKDKPDSPLAAEGLYHLGESQYVAKDYAHAAQSYFAAMQSAAKANSKAGLAEKAAHKLAWSYYQQGQFDKAQQSFDYQVSTFATGELMADALFMAAESVFKQGKFEPALAAYQKSFAKPPADKDFQALATLHAAQANGQLKKWNDSAKLLADAGKKFAESAYLPELLYEQAWALQNLGRPDEAFKLYDQVAASSDREVGARARFMMGELLFEKKDYKEAVRNFFKVSYGYGYPDSAAPLKKWQADAAYEAARCFETLAGVEAAKKAQWIEQAKKSYREVVDKYPTSDKAALAKSRLDALGA